MQTTPEADSADLRELLRPIWTRRWIILVVVVVATSLTYVYEERKPDAFTAATRIYIESSETADLGGGVQYLLPQTDRNTLNQATLLQSRTVATEVARKLRFTGSPDELLASIQVSPEAGKDFVAITATRSTPQSAADLANAFAEAFIGLRAKSVRDKLAESRRIAQQQLDQLPRTVAARPARGALQAQLQRLDVLDALPNAAASQPDRAVAPGIRSAPRPRRAALFAFALSFVLAVLLAFGLQRIDRGLRRLSELSPAYKLPVLAALPRAPRAELEGTLKLSESFREVFRGLRTNLQLAGVDHPIRTLLVTSGAVAEGKSTVVKNLALAYQEAGLRVAVIECDLRRPTLAEQLHVNAAPGLTQVLLGECTLRDAIQMAPVEIYDRSEALAGGGSYELARPSAAGRLSVITSGGHIANPPTVLGDRRMRRVIESARENTDIVIIDSPPLLAVADTLPLLTMVDGTLIVARLGVSTRTTARRVNEILERVPGVEILGIVANNVPDADLGEARYGYAYGV